MANSANNADYVTVRIPRELADEIDQIIQSGILGYRSRAEIASEALPFKHRAMFKIDCELYTHSK
jgi:hypothetical protein